MILCLDVGNTQVFGGVFAGDRLISQFRRTSQLRSSSDELGVFFRGVLRENDIDPGLIQEIVICSVVPDLNYSLQAGTGLCGQASKLGHVFQSLAINEI